MTECVTPGGVLRIRESTDGPLSDVSVQVRRGPFPVAERLPGKRRCSKSFRANPKSRRRVPRTARRAPALELATF